MLEFYNLGGTPFIHATVPSMRPHMIRSDMHKCIYTAEVPRASATALRLLLLLPCGGAAAAASKSTRAAFLGGPCWCSRASFGHWSKSHAAPRGYSSRLLLALLSDSPPAQRNLGLRSRSMQLGAHLLGSALSHVAGAWKFLQMLMPSGIWPSMDCD